MPPGDVLVRVAWSSVNYKDALACIANGGVAHTNPLVPGIDLAGTVVTSRDRRFVEGASVVAHGYELGVSRHGGFAEYARLPSRWLVPLPAQLTLRDSMVIGTAGFTAALAVTLLRTNGLRPTRGPVLVTGASGGVGRMAVAILASAGYDVWAAAAKPDQADELRAVGAAGVVSREEVTATSDRALRGHPPGTGCDAQRRGAWQVGRACGLVVVLCDLVDQGGRRGSAIGSAWERRRF